MKKLIKAETSSEYIEYDLAEYSRNEGNKLIDAAVRNCSYVEIQYNGTNGAGGCKSVFEKLGQQWAWMNPATGKVVNYGTLNEKNSLNWSPNDVVRELQYIWVHNECTKLKVK